MSGTRLPKDPLVDLAAIEHRIAQSDADTKQAEITTPVGQSERRYRHLVENSLGLICTHDLDGTVLSINPAAAQSLGYEPHESVGKNLREFLAPDTRHLLDAYLAGRYVVLSVSDTGHGIDEETRPHIFEPFFTTKSPGEGTGLGLATVCGIVNQNDGYICVDSTPAQGTLFSIYLPEGAVTADDRPAHSEETTRPRAGTETILLAEDEETVRSLMRTALEQQGYTVIDAANGVDALHLFDEYAGSIDMLVTDVVMPHMSGRQLHAALRSRHAHLKVLFLSGYADEFVASQFVTGPHAEFLQKPFTLESLTRTVRELLDARPHSRTSEIG